MAHINEKYDLTVSAMILHPTELKICLLIHRKLLTWIQPGGHVELEEDPIQGLEHELLEETGLAREDYEFIEPNEQPYPRGFKTLPIPMHINVHPFGDTDHSHIDFVYLLRSKTNKLAPLADESQDIGWFNLNEIRQLYKVNKMHDGTYDLCRWIFERYE
jgi:8-oxo-dGTP diphosphatase